LGLTGDRGFARPDGPPRVHSEGANALRLLLIGDLETIGSGVLSHDLGLAGHLARRLSARSGRGVDIDILCADGMTADSCRDALDLVDVTRFEAIVLSIGLPEARRLTSPRTWGYGLAAVLDYCITTSDTVQLVVLALPPGRVRGAFPPLMAPVIDQQLRDLNAVSEIVCRHRARVSIVAGSPTERANGSSSQFFDEWAALIAPAVHAVPDPRAGRMRSAQQQDEGARQHSLDALAILEEPEARIDRITNSTRDLFGAVGAAVTFIDRDRQWVKSSLGMGDVDTLRIGEFADMTIRTAEIFVVEDASKDPRFRDHPSVTGGQHVRFYAGYPIESPDGRRVGALCIVDTRPRTFSRSESSLLRGLALQVQSQLWADAPGARLVSHQHAGDEPG
jgi:hypothetical protein